MSLKYSNTTADYLRWDEAMNLIRKLAKDGAVNHSSLAITKRYLGLRQEEILQTYDCLSF